MILISFLLLLVVVVVDDFVVKKLSNIFATDSEDLEALKREVQQSNCFTSVFVCLSIILIGKALGPFGSWDVLSILILYAYFFPIVILTKSSMIAANSLETLLTSVLKVSTSKSFDSSILFFIFLGL